MQLLTRAMLDEYLRDDVIERLLDENVRGDDESFTTQRWLRESAPKRCIFHALYGDLLHDSHVKSRVLDIGGGYTSLTRVLARQHEYTLLDIMSNDSCEAVHTVEQELGNSFLVHCDWFEYAEKADEYDVIVANDLFPNVDQRLEFFLDRYLPRCTEMRLSLTVYNTPRCYSVKRVDGDEVFHMLAWDGERTRAALERFCEIDTETLSVLSQDPPSLYPNGRQVCLLTVPGGKRC